MSEDDVPPWEADEGRYSITLKGHKDYSATWINLSDKTAGGLKRRILAFFGWGEQEYAEMSLADAVFNATQTLHAQYAIGEGFSGARSIGRSSGARERAFASAAEQAPPDPKEILLAQIDEQSTVAALKRLYAENKTLFEADASLVGAYKAKGKALMAATA